MCAKHRRRGHIRTSDRCHRRPAEGRKARPFSSIALDMDPHPAIPPGMSTQWREPFRPAPHCPTATSRPGSATAVSARESVSDGAKSTRLILPCHRVLAAGGKVGGFSAAGGVTTKLRLLEIEGAQVGEAPTSFDSLPLATRPRR